MAKAGTTVTTEDKEGEARVAATPGVAGSQPVDAAANATAARRPVRAPAGKPGAPNKGKPGKANRGNRSARAQREDGGANKKPADVEAAEPGKDEDEEEGPNPSASDFFWKYLVAGSYSSRKARGDWGGEGEG